VPKARAERAKGGRGRLLAVLVVVGLLAVGLLTRAGGLLGGSVRVPEVVGLEVAEATRDLEGRGLRVRTGPPVASDHVHEGLVATQSVDGGERARRQDTVVIQPSLGIVLPDLAGRPADAAAILAHHWSEAGDSERAVRYLISAAEQAGRGWATGEAIALYNQALELIPEGDEDRLLVQPVGVEPPRHLGAGGHRTAVRDGYRLIEVISSNNSS
jgi:hypothetical protein